MSPNPRLQRTPLRAPLSRTPFGAKGSIAPAILLGMSLACCWSPGYQGDGRIVAQGFAKPFQLDLGTIDLSLLGSRLFSMRGLSGHQLVIGFLAAESMSDAVVRLSMSNDRSETVIDQRAALGSWVWEGGRGLPEAFVYRRGESRDIPIPGTSSVNVEAIGVRSNGGWGTYFRPAPRVGFKLSVEVVRATSASRPLAPLVVKCVVGSM